MMSRADVSHREQVGGFRVLLTLGLLLFTCRTEQLCLADDPGPENQSTADDQTKKSTAPEARLKRRKLDKVVESDNWTFRPTVLVRRGSSQGTGTIIASLDRETLVLTAGHVIRGRGPILVQLHRYNLGIEQQPTIPGKWPRQVVAEQVAVDNLADLAILRLRDMIALPFVARLAPDDFEPASNTGLTSVGIDLGAKLSSWNTQLVEILWFELNDSGTDRPFLVTTRIPEHGRSGGGLFDSSGTLVGVCVGHAELVKGKRMGVFSSIENVRQLLREHELTSVIERSEARRARLARNGAAAKRLGHSSRSAVTPTDAMHETDTR